MGTSLSGNRSCCDARIAMGASLFLHALLVLVLSSNSELTPALGSQTRIDLFWLTPAPETPAAQPARETAPASEAAANTAKAAALAQVRSGEGGAPQQSAVPPADKAFSPSITGVFPAPDAKASPPPGDGETRGAPPAPVTGAPRLAGEVSAEIPPRAPATPVALEQEGAPTVSAAPAALSPPTAASLPAPTEREVSYHPAPPVTARMAASPPVEQPVEQPAARVETMATGPAERTRERERPATQETAARAPAQPERASRIPATARKERELLGWQPSKKQRGLVVSSLRGDLKLVSAGDSVKISVAFRALPRSRRNRPPGRSEAQLLQEITPVCAAGPDGTSEAVIEKAEEGVYIFSAQPRDRTAAQASFTLKVHESGPGKKVTLLGRRNISGQSAVAKVLMPEAILWDDESAFTGSIEDSESTTKFNTQTGVYWKEYD